MIAAKMNRVYQTTFGGAFETDKSKRGDCLSACVATYLGMNIKDVPRFVDQDSVNSSYGEYIKFMNKHGFHPTNLTWNMEKDDTKRNIHGIIKHCGSAPIFVGIESGDPTCLHMVIFKDGKLWHDPGMKELDPDLDRYGKIIEISFILTLK